MFRVFRLNKDTKGQSVIEFAFMLPLFLILILGIIQFGFILSAQIAVTNAAREGARAAAVGTPLGSNTDSEGTGTVYGIVKSALGGHQYITYDGLDIPGPLNDTLGESVEVSVNGLYVETIVPIGKLAGNLMFDEENIVDRGFAFPVDGTATMRLEHIPETGDE